MIDDSIMKPQNQTKKAEKADSNTQEKKGKKNPNNSKQYANEGNLFF